MQHSEKMKAIDAAVARLGWSAEMAEHAQLAGFYPAICTGPREEDIAEYASIRDRMWAAEKVGNLLAAAEMRALLARIPVEKKWEDVACNLITNIGGAFVLDNALAGSGYTAAWYMGLISNGSYTTGPALGDTMASHAGWTESTAYSNGTRIATAWSAASGKSKSLSAGLVFNINATDTIKGCFLNSVSTKGGTTGTLLSAGLWTGGDQPVVNTNTLTASYTATI